jgi:hypothetical protein
MDLITELEKLQALRTQIKASQKRLSAAYSEYYETLLEDFLDDTLTEIEEKITDLRSELKQSYSRDDQ